MIFSHSIFDFGLSVCALHQCESDLPGIDRMAGVIHMLMGAGGLHVHACIDNSSLPNFVSHILQRTDANIEVGMLY